MHSVVGRLTVWTGVTLAAFGVSCSALVDFHDLAGSPLGVSDAAAGDVAASDGAAPIDDASSGGDAASIPDGASDAAAPVFFDDFNRADGPVIGNGWLMKNPNAFVLSGGAARRVVSDSLDFQNNIVYRPLSESVMDPRVSIEATLNAGPGYPQVLARVQSGTLTQAGNLDAYVFFIDNQLGRVTMGRVHATGGLNRLKFVPVSPNLEYGQTYRLTLDVAGANPVALIGTVEHLSGGSWVPVTTVQVSDADSSNQIGTAGTIGFSGGEPESTGFYSYDNFTRWR